MPQYMPQFATVLQVMPDYRDKYVKYTGSDRMFENINGGRLRLPKGAIGVCYAVIGPKMFVGFRDTDTLMHPPYKFGLGHETQWKYQVEIYPYDDPNWEVEL